MIQVSNLDQVLDFFLRNSAGDLKCLAPNGETEIVSCYPDAKTFFDKHIIHNNHDQT